MYIIQIFDEAEGNEWKDTNWTNHYHRFEFDVLSTDKPLPVCKKVAFNALKEARALFPEYSYMIVKVKNIA